MLMIQDKNINQSTCLFLSTEIPSSIPVLFLKYLLAKNLRKILQILAYIEQKDWLVGNLMESMQKILQEKIFENNLLLSKNSHIISLWQVFLKYDSCDFPTNKVLFFISDLIFLFLEKNSNYQLSRLNNKKSIPTRLQMKIMDIY